MSILLIFSVCTTAFCSSGTTCFPLAENDFIMLGYWTGTVPPAFIISGISDS
jgi:hypothetical protein